MDGRLPESFLRSESIPYNCPAVKSIYAGRRVISYLAVTLHAVSSALVKEEGRVQKPVYYTSRALRGAEERYPQIEKLAFALITTSRKLRHYF